MFRSFVRRQTFCLLPVILGKVASSSWLAGSANSGNVRGAILRFRSPVRARIANLFVNVLGWLGWYSPIPHVESVRTSCAKRRLLPYWFWRNWYGFDTS